MLRTTPDLIGVLSTAEAKRRAPAQSVKDEAIDRRGYARSPATKAGFRLGVEPPNKGKTYPPEPLTQREVLALLAACGRGASGIRNKALIVVLWRSGLRVAEALALEPKDINLETGQIAVLHGKGDRSRIVGMDPMACAIVEQWLQAPAQARREGRAEGVLRDQQAHDRRAAALQLRPEHGQGDWAACGDREACAPAWPATYPCIRARRRARRPAPHTTPARSRQPRRYCPLYRASEPLRGGGGNSRAILASSGIQQLPVSAGRPIRLPPAVDSEQRLVGLLTVAGLFDVPGLLHRGAGPAPHPGLEVRQAPRRFAARLSGQLGSEVGHVVPELLQRDGARGALRHAGCCSRAEQTDPPAPGPI